MAVAGKAGLTFEGAWSSTKQYDRLTAVSYNNKLYISRKRPPIGEAPMEGEYWMLANSEISPEEWATKFDKTGGNLSGSLIAFTDEDVTRHVRVRNAKRSVEMASYEGGAFRLYDYTNAKAIISSTPEGVNTFNGSATSLGGETAEEWQGKIDKKFNKSGGTITDDLTIEKANRTRVILSDTTTDRSHRFQDTSDADANTVTLIANTKADDTSTLHGIVIRPETVNVSKAVAVRRSVNGTTNYYDVLHTGNKPTGTYTGNGSTTQRTIRTGAIGNAAVIWVSGDQNKAALITPAGAFIKDSNGVNQLPNYEGYINSGTIYIASTHANLNASGVTYEYAYL